jgi:hypothetical protein
MEGLRTLFITAAAQDGADAKELNSVGLSIPASTLLHHQLDPTTSFFRIAGPRSLARWLLYL